VLYKKDGFGFSVVHLVYRDKRLSY